MRRARLAIALLALALAPAPRAWAGPADRAQKCASDSYRGQEERDRGAFVEARASFRACAADDCPALVRKDCAQWLADVETSVPTVVFVARDPQGNDVLGVEVSIDGVLHQADVESGRPVALDPGRHVFRFVRGHDAPVELIAVLRTGEHNRLIAATLGPAAPAPPAAPVPAAPVLAAPGPLPRAAPSVRYSTWAFVAGGVAVAGAASFAYFGATGLDQKSQLRASCGNHCSDADVAPLRTKYLVADTSLGLGVVAAAIATWLFLHPSSEPAVGVSIDPGRRGVAFSVGRGF